MQKKVFLLAGILILPCFASASEVTGTINTWVSTGMNGTVISVPTFSPVAGVYTSGQSVTLGADGATAICYRTDGTAPACLASNSCLAGSTLYASALSVTTTTTVQAVACYPGNLGTVATSGVSSSTFTITPVSSGGGGGGGGWGGGGGGWSTLSITAGASSSSTTQPIVSSTVSGALVTNTVPAATLRVQDLVFKDIANNWAKDYIQVLAVRKIIGNTDMYRPDDSLTRAELLKIAGKAAGWQLPIVTKSSFSDILRTDWYAPYAEYARSHGIISPAQTFRPNDSISRAEVAKILAWALGLKGKAPIGLFADTSVSWDLTPYIEAMKNAHIFDGQQASDGRLLFRPFDLITRAEIAKVVVKAFQLQ